MDGVSEMLSRLARASGFDVEDRSTAVKLALFAALVADECMVEVATSNDRKDLLPVLDPFTLGESLMAHAVCMRATSAIRKKFSVTATIGAKEVA